MQEDAVNAGRREDNGITRCPTLLFKQVPARLILVKQYADHPTECIISYLRKKPHVRAEDLHRKPRVCDAPARMNTDAVHVNELARPEQTADIRGVCICRKNRRDIEADMASNNCFLCAHFMFLLKIMIHPVLQNENRGHHEELSDH